MTPYEIRSTIAKITKTPQPLKESLGIISARLKDGYEPWQIMGYMEWLTHQTWLRTAPTLRFCTIQNLSKWINDGEPLPQGSKLNRPKYAAGRGKKEVKALGEGFRLHATDLEMYLRCPKQLWFKMVKGPRPPAAAAFRGSCFHKTLHANFEQKIESKADITIVDAKDIFGTSWDDGVEKVEFKEDENSGEIKDEGYSMVDVYWEKMAPEIQPIESEKGFETDLGIIPVAGTIDRITETRLFDDKTAKRMWRDGSGRLQPLLYSLAHYQETDALLPFAFIVTTPKETEEVLVELGARDLYWFLTVLLPGVYDDIQTGRFTPNPTGWWCSEKWCGWWDLCRGKEEPKAFTMLKRAL